MLVVRRTRETEPPSVDQFCFELSSKSDYWGSSAVNAASCAALNSIDHVHYVGPISPPVVFHQKALSKVLRTARLRGNFFFYSQTRLEKIAAEVQSQSRSDATLDFFHGFTPWIATRPGRRYLAWSDCIFHDYIRIFHDYGRFSVVDVDRIERGEASWLKGAYRVLFSTRWAANRAAEVYGLDAAHVESTGIFGELDNSGKDGYSGAQEFAFVATNFAAKGGHTVLSAFRQLRRSDPDVLLTVIGERPAGVSDEPGVEFAGFLRKEIPDEYARFRQILGRVRALVHPTTSDISPLIIVEAAYLGCPVIASNRFAIPELVDHDVTGILLDDLSPGAVAESMRMMLMDNSRYWEMRRQARSTASKRHSKSAFEARLHAPIAPLLAAR